MRLILTVVKQTLSICRQMTIYCVGHLVGRSNRVAISNEASTRVLNQFSSGV